MNHTRRTVLTGIATTTAITLAGCNATPGNGTGSGNKNTPVAVTRRYYQAANETDMQTLEKVTHPASQLAPPEQGYYARQDITINNIQRANLNNGPVQIQDNQITRDIIEQSFQRQFENPPTQDEYTVVIVELTRNGRETTYPMRVVKQNGDWKVLP